MYSLENTAVDLGLSKTYFYSMKKVNIEAYNWLLSFDRNPKQSYLKALLLVERQRHDLQDLIYDMLEHRGELTAFSRYLCEIGFYKNAKSFVVGVDKKFRVVRNKPYQTYIKDKRLIELIKEFKNAR